MSMCCWVISPFFVIFAVLDVSLAVNLCINCIFLHLYLQFYYISELLQQNCLFGLRSQKNHSSVFSLFHLNILFPLSRLIWIPVCFWWHVEYTVTSSSWWGGEWYSLNSRPYLKLVFGNVNLNSCCVPILQSLASTVAKIGRGSQLFGCCLGPDPRQFLVQNVVFW